MSRLQQSVSENPATSVPSPSTRPFWPDAVAYREAVQHTGSALLVPEFIDGSVRLDRLGLPVAYSGRFAVVFPLTARDGRVWAVRCFTTAGDRTTRHARYDAVGRHLERVPALRDVLTPFHYEEQGIRVGGRTFPLLAMRWAGGTPLGRWVEERRDDPAAMLRAARALGRLRETLEASNFAHGDWQHDNLLVDDDGTHIALVDYDGVYVPEIADALPEEQGHPNYQHPARSVDDFGPFMDRFSCLLIQTALAALAVDPSLWDTFSDGESLLFRRGDLIDTENAAVFAAIRLVAYRSPVLGGLIRSLEDACAGESQAAPVVRDAVFDELAAELSVDLAAAVPARPRASAARRDNPAAAVAPPRVMPKTVTLGPVSAMPTALATVVLSPEHEAYLHRVNTMLGAHRRWDRVHRAVTLAAFALLAAFAGWANASELAAAPLLLVLFPGAMMAAISYYLWPKNQNLCLTMGASLDIQTRLRSFDVQIQSARASLARMNGDPSLQSIVAFVGAALHKVRLWEATPISGETVGEWEAVLHTGLTPDDMHKLRLARIQRLSELPPKLPCLISATGEAGLYGYRDAVIADARKAYEQAAGERRDLQREIDRLEAERAGLRAVGSEISQQAGHADDVSFGRFVAHLFGF